MAKEVDILYGTDTTPVVIHTKKAHAFADGDQVRVLEFSDRALNGDHYVRVRTSTSVELYSDSTLRTPVAATAAASLAWAGDPPTPATAPRGGGYLKDASGLDPYVAPPKDSAMGILRSEQSTPMCVVTVRNHRLEDGDRVTISGHSDSAANGTWYVKTGRVSRSNPSNRLFLYGGWSNGDGTSPVAATDLGSTARTLGNVTPI